MWTELKGPKVKKMVSIFFIKVEEENFRDKIKISSPGLHEAIPLSLVRLPIFSASRNRCR